MVIHKRFTEDDEVVTMSSSSLPSSAAPPLQRTPVKKSKKNDMQSRPQVEVPTEPEAQPTAQSSTQKKQQQIHSKSIASQIRGLERLLAKKRHALPAGAVASKETKLKELKRMASERGRRKHEFKSSKRYHMIRFFERRKLERALEKETDEEKRKKLQTDLTYVIHYPKGKKYIALFPKNGHTHQSQQQVDEIRSQIDQSFNDDSNEQHTNNKNENDNDINRKNHNEDDDKQNDSEKDDFFL